MRRRTVTSVTVLFAWVCACGGVSASPTPHLPPGWSQLADLPVGVAKFGVAAHGGKLYVLGGYDTRHSVWVYDIASNRWSSGPALPRGTDNVAALATADRVYALGGEASTAFQVFAPGSGQWSAGPTLPRVSFAAAAAVLNGRMHLVGGWNYNNTASASVATHSVFNPASASWSNAAPLTTARNAAAAATLGGGLYVVGGRAPGIRATDQQSLAAVEVYQPGNDQWVSAPPLPTARSGLALIALGGRLYALGGESNTGGVSHAVERFDPATQTWSTLSPMPMRSHGLGAVVVGDAIYVMGGFTQAGDAVGSESVALYRYQPS